MKFRFLFALAFATAAYADPFPGVRTVLTPQEMALSGLDKLTPGQIAIIDAALSRHYRDEIKKEVAAAPSAKGSKFGLPDLGNDWRDQPVLKATVVKWTGSNSFLLDNGQEWTGDEAITFEIVGKAVEIQPRPLHRFALVIPGEAGPARVRRLR